MVSALRLQVLNNRVYRVLFTNGLHVGNLKLISGIWKFKAIGYDAEGQVVPGGGPLTDKHNVVIIKPDEADLNQLLVS